MSVCVLQNLEKYRVLWTDFSASCREINRFLVSKIDPEPAKPTISLALGYTLSKQSQKSRSILLDGSRHSDCFKRETCISYDVLRSYTD